MNFEPSRFGLGSQLCHLINFEALKKVFIFFKPQASSVEWRSWYNLGSIRLKAISEYQVCCLVCSGCSVVAFTAIPGVPDLAHGWGGGPTKDAGRLGFYPKTQRRLAWGPGLWQPRKAPSVEWIFLTHHIGNWTNLRFQISVISEEKPSNPEIFSTQAENIFRRKRTTLWPTLTIPAGVYRSPGIQGLFASEM